jgi:glycerophosphoryl diester phosphodiesterase
MIFTIWYQGLQICHTLQPWCGRHWPIFRETELKMTKTHRADWITIRPIAHRGLHDKSSGILENSLSAARAAVEAGYGIEVDLHPSADLVPMVFHDDVLDRMTNEKGPMRSHSAKALGRFRLGGVEGNGDTVPSLRQLLDLVGGKVGLVLELKGIVGEDEGFVEAVLNVLEGYDGPVAIMSFNHWLLEDARRLGSKVPVGLTAEGNDKLYGLHSETVKKLDIEFVSYGIDDLPNRFVAEFRATGRPVITWTIRNRELAAKSAKYADQITFEGYLP